MTAEPAPWPWRSGSVPSICRYQCRSFGWWVAKYNRPRAHATMWNPTRRVVASPSLASVYQPIGNVPGGFQIAAHRCASVEYTSPNGSRRAATSERTREACGGAARVGEQPCRQRVVVNALSTLPRASPNRRHAPCGHRAQPPRRRYRVGSGWPPKRRRLDRKAAPSVPERASPNIDGDLARFAGSGTFAIAARHRG